MKRNWKWKSASEEAVQQLSQQAGLSPLLARLLTQRGITTAAQAHAFLFPGEQEVPSPFQFSEMEKAVARIHQALDRRERVLIHGDYDVDGITSTCILLETFREMGLEAEYYIPGRLEEGYGLQVERVEKLAGQCDLLITVDCGTTSVEAVRRANDLKIDVIITDHHDPGPERPPAVAVLNPQREEETYPEKCLSGAGVAWKLAQALREVVLSRPDDSAQLDLVALGTVADVVPLLGENRILVQRALKGFHENPRPGLWALMDLVKVIPAQITAQSIAYRLAPRLNAAGRMDHPRYALDLLMTRDPDEGRELAFHLQQLNLKRQGLESKIFTEAGALIERDGPLTRGEPVLVVWGEGWHRGVLGIVAARLVQYYQRPVFLMTVEEGVAYGSARSVDGVNLLPLLDAARPYAISCGGHEEAAGMKVEIQHLPQFKNAICETAASLGLEVRPSPLWIDASLPLEQVDLALWEEIQRLEPFGAGNEEPVFAAQAELSGMGARIVGNNHLRLTLRHPRGFINAIGFGQGDKLEPLTGGVLEIAFTCHLNEYRGRREIDLHLKDLRPAAPAVPSPATPVLETSSSGWDRQTLGRLYRLLQKSCNEERIIALQNAELLAKIAKMSLKDFYLGLKIFQELGLVSLERGQLKILAVDVKRELTDSPTFRSLASSTAKPER
ncbi:MAG: single-stranded-DNA-specific exonuclease RecJ [Candidatus Omnitrophica bacterium]|nr:single-stranded-DNA-specific exonuclease RecJ [Candidatus Omnitrophota bacterium]